MIKTYLQNFVGKVNKLLSQFAQKIITLT